MRSDKHKAIVYEDWYLQQLVELGYITPKEVEEIKDEHNSDSSVPERSG